MEPLSAQKIPKLFIIIYSLSIVLTFLYVFVMYENQILIMQGRLQLAEHERTAVLLSEHEV